MNFELRAAERRRMQGEQEQVDLKGAVWMLVSAVLFAENTLLIRAAALVSGDANGWMATLFRGVIGVLLLLIFYSGGKGLSWSRMFANRLVVARGLVGCVGLICFYVTIAQGSSLQMTLPIFTAAGAYFAFGEKFEGYELFGAMVTLVAIWRVAGRKKVRGVV